MGSRESRVARMPWRSLLGWSGLGVLLVAAFFAALGTLNQTLYGASNFVERYLNAIADDEITAAAATPGVALSPDALAELGLPANVSTAMLRSRVVAVGPADVQIVSDEAHADGSHTVVASYRLGEAIEQAEFEVRPIAPLYGVLNRWQFAKSPLAIVDVTAAHNPFFTVGDLQLDARALKTGDELAAFTQTASYLAIAPAEYEFSYESDLLVAAPVEVPVEASGRVGVTIDAQPTPAFVDRVQTQLDSFLQNCAAQVVLQPTDCPFGIEITDRVVSDAQWSIAALPVVTLTAGDTAFEMPPTAGVAHISVELQSLFDGEFYTEEQDVSFTVALDASVKSDGSISVQLK